MNARLNSLVSLLLMVVGLQVSAQSVADKYWVFFNDKGDVSQLKPEDFLTQRAIARRERMGIPIQLSDYPLPAGYAAGLRQLGAHVLYPSKWLNAISVRMDEATAAIVAEVEGVKEVRRIPKVIRVLDAPNANSNARAGYSAGFSQTQLKMIGVDMLHKNGFNGSGVVISMMDNGFRNADKNPILSHLFESGRILATRDFVNQEDDVYDQGDHGAFTLSILGGWSEDNDETQFWFSGSAPGATFILCHTESDASETSQEEDNWVAAMEFADSLGADVFSTSLGYRGFDGGGGYTYADMDGNTTIITRAADMAAAKGIVVVNSAGNDGPAKMLAPSDGDSVISVGAVNANRSISGFSSHGPSYDQRIKPDISAMGEGTAFVRPEGTLSVGNGTSFSCPVSSGMIACLVQAAPQATNMEIYRALIQSADRYESPDTFYGYGIPSGPEAYRILTGQQLAGVPKMVTMMVDSIEAYPNPATDHLNIAVDNDAMPYEGNLQVIDMMGKLVFERKVTIHSFYNVIRLTRADFGHLHSGRYHLLLRDADSNVKHSTKISILTER